LNPFQGEGGFTKASGGFLEEASCPAVMSRNVIILDEIQIGVCAYRHYCSARKQAGIEADLMTTAKKAFAGGIPTTASLFGKADIMDASNPSGLGWARMAVLLSVVRRLLRYLTLIGRGETM